MVLPAGPKSRNKTALDLSAAPADLAAARVWVLRELFGVELYEWQRDVFAALGGRERPRVAYVQVPRKNGKSMLVAAFALSELVLLPERHIYGISDSERNLNSVLVREIRTLIGRSQAATDALHITKHGIENPHNGSFFEVRPSNFRASQGINPHLVLFDEVHLQRTDEVWSGMQMSGAARDDALLLGITTPGYDQTSLAHDLYQRVRNEDPDVHGVLFEAPDPDCDLDDRDQWAAANPCMAELPKFAESMEFDRKTLPEHEFRRFRLGQWTATESAWLPYGAWAARTSTERFDETARTWLGFDGSYSGDSTALVAVNDKGQILVLGVWEKPAGQGGRKADTWRVPRDEVDAAMHAAFARFNVVIMLADPPYWQAEIETWRRAYPRRVVDFPTGVSARMAPACTGFYSAVMEGRLTDCTPPGPLKDALAAHLANCATKPTPHGTVITKQKEWSPKKIDLAIATVVASSLALVPAKPERKIFVL